LLENEHMFFLLRSFSYVRDQDITTVKEINMCINEQGTTVPQAIRLYNNKKNETINVWFRTGRTIHKYFEYNL